MFKQFSGLLVLGFDDSLVRVLKADLNGLAAAANAIREGGIICYPTDTVYGLGCDPLNESAVERTMRAKGDRRKPMPILVKAIEDAQRLANVSKRAAKLAEEFWPGPLTMVLSALKVVPATLARDGKVGLRSPKHAICHELLGLCSGMLVGTSANLTGKPAAVSADEVLKQLGARVDIVLDGGISPLGISSTVVDLTHPRLSLVREGPIGMAEIVRCLRET